MRSKDKVNSQGPPGMTDKQKGGRKGKFRFRGGGNKKENGMVPNTSGPDPVDEEVATEDITSLGSANNREGYTLSNSDVLNDTIEHSNGDGGKRRGNGHHGNGSVSHGDDQQLMATHGDHMICTCPPPHEEVIPVNPALLSSRGSYGHSSYYMPNGNHRVEHNGRGADHGHQMHPNKPNGEQNNKVSVVAVIEGGSSQAARPEQGVNTSSSNESSSSTSVCSVRPKVPTPCAKVGDHSVPNHECQSSGYAGVSRYPGNAVSK